VPTGGETGTREEEYGPPEGGAVGGKSSLRFHKSRPATMPDRVRNVDYVHTELRKRTHQEDRMERLLRGKIKKVESLEKVGGSTSLEKI